MSCCSFFEDAARARLELVYAPVVVARDEQLARCVALSCWSRIASPRARARARILDPAG
jgi:hypothetical protein